MSEPTQPATESDSREKPDWGKVVEPTVIVTLITGISYVIGREHLNAYYRGFDVDADALGLPTSRYLLAAWLPFCVLGFLLITTYEPNRREKTHPKIAAFQSYLPFILLVILATQATPGWALWLQYLVVGIVMLVAVILSLKGFHARQLVFPLDWRAQITNGLVLAVLMGFIASGLGNADAREVIAHYETAALTTVRTKADAPIDFPDEGALLVYRGATFTIFLQKSKQGNRLIEVKNDAILEMVSEVRPPKHK